jgi:hypothetical protein
MSSDLYKKATLALRQAPTKAIYRGAIGTNPTLHSDVDESYSK